MVLSLPEVGQEYKSKYNNTRVVVFHICDERVHFYYCSLGYDLGGETSKTPTYRWWDIFQRIDEPSGY